MCFLDTIENCKFGLYFKVTNLPANLIKREGQIFKFDIFICYFLRRDNQYCISSPALHSRTRPYYVVYCNSSNMTILYKNGLDRYSDTYKIETDSMVDDNSRIDSRQSQNVGEACLNSRQEILVLPGGLCWLGQIWLFCYEQESIP